MLSYRHAFHAGNHADVLKHSVLVAIAKYFHKKQSAYTYIDTHSGAGVYKLSDDLANKTQEYKTGIARLYPNSDLALISPYLEQVRVLNAAQGEEKNLQFYPGSPWFMTELLREQDQAHLFELHPQDHALLEQNMNTGKQLKVHMEDGFSGIKAVLPPQTKRAFIVIDPPYEQANEYKKVVNAIEQGIKRFAVGVFAVWYPLLNRNDKQGMSETMVDELAKTDITKYLDVRLWTSKQTQGMYGSGLFIVNPPYILQDLLNQELPKLLEVLGLDETAGFSVDYVEK
ncbi:23S rRNA (adenine(2030)-N(6))-methyltransferase RlmJ [Bermanella marisrubri]|uniref:Ribosomal RNA large subunit methyltransferase J n=1 Tax=Bermanella marisrubri TaxID=207949 RepID=Q1N5H6_9GAMM|nr:23S rRNA (adenine(2030)-N(6))-methyltransferase RlmJ [Bermanella marisrubri]EAT13966.1 hypothetical protein RED65_11249 [Oceanobacter sp. RED65] [Bermanella marisrubri]QIZ84716.1 23S rRNA (adenine(2030)-N(6))-methyltransferase RlmJ [Bermanella marisrubri]